MSEQIKIDRFKLEGMEVEQDLQQFVSKYKEELEMAGIVVNELERSGTYLHLNQNPLQCKSHQSGLEILDIKDALSKYDGLPDYYWKAVDKNKDEYTKLAASKVHGGYFIRVSKNVKIKDPVQSCLFIKDENVGQSVHNIVVVEEGAEVHIITGCATSHKVKSALHLGISEFFLKKGAKLTFTMVHNWGEQVEVRPRTVGILEQDAVFQSNYILLKPVKIVQSFPVVYLNGSGAVARFNSILVATPGSYINSGNKIVLNAPNTRGEIISRAITTGGEIIAPGVIEANNVPAKGHLECKGLILNDGVIHAIPELKGTRSGVELSHEAAVGKIAQEEIEYLMARGLDEDEATSTIVRGFMNVDIMGLPLKLKQAIDKIIAETEKDMF
ncbi:MAG: SufD family Fe-S cluster assembly protein [Desulfonauticus sp.]|nr:SufD family Fe-S cluster assembly protein [Desulfonauticus sp.]